MPTVRNLLDRFRPAGAPGAPSAAGVPADRRASAAAELAPVFAALASTARQCAALRAAAADDGARQEAEAIEQARTLVARSRVDAQAQRSAAATTAYQHGAAEAARIGERATAQSEAIQREAQRDQPALVAAAVARVRAELHDWFPGDRS